LIDTLFDEKNLSRWYVFNDSVVGYIFGPTSTMDKMG